MQSWEEQISAIVKELDIAIEGFTLSEKTSKEDEKKLKKKIKKYAIEKDDSKEKAVEKTKKLLDELYKLYEVTAKQNAKTSLLRSQVESSQEERNKAQSQIKTMENLHKGFMKKYNDMVAEAQTVEKQEEEKRKKLIEEIQERIKNVQDEYETAGKMKIEKFRENETLKHEISKMEQQLVTSESLFDAQLKKKQIEVEISMTTLKQKLELMNNFKTMGAETKAKIEQSQEKERKILPRLEIVSKKEDEHKIQIARVHLVMEDYKKSIMKINQLLQKREKDARVSIEKLSKAEEGVKDINNKLKALDQEYETNEHQIKMLLTLEENLRKELAA